MSDAASLKAAANAAFAAKDFEKASQLYSDAIKVDPSNHVLYSNRSASKTSLKDYKGALEDAEKCIELDKTFVKGYARKGAALHGQRQYEDAVMAYEEGLQIDPNNAPITKALNDLKPLLSSSSNPNASDAASGLGNLFSDPNMFGKLASNPKTAEFMKDEKFVGKLREMQRGGGGMGGAGGGMENMLGDKRMLTVLGVLMGVDMQAFERPEGSDEMPPGFKSQDEDVEMTDASQPTPAPSTSTRKGASVEDEPEQTKSTNASSSSTSKTTPAPKPKAAAEPIPEPEEEPTEDDLNKKKALEFKSKGTEAYKARDFEKAAGLFEQAWESWQGDVSFLTNLSAVYFEMADYVKCIETCEKAVEEGRPLRADYKIIAKVLGREGSAYEKQGDLTNAIKYFNKSLTEHRTPDVLQKLRDAEKAKKEADKQAYINPELAEAAREEGNTQFKAGQFADAVKSYSEAIKRAPSDARGYNNLAAAYTKLVAFPEALKASDQAIACDPTFIKAYIRKAMVLIGMKDYEQALTVCQVAMEQDTEKKHTREIETQMQKAIMETQTQRQGETDEQTLERAMKNPEIAQIMSDPVMQSILQSAQQDPKSLQDHMRKSPMIKAKIEKLVRAGIIKTR